MTNGSGTWANNQPPAAAEKLWRGLALVGAFHIGGMLINVIFQMMGNNSLDGNSRQIPRSLNQSAKKSISSTLARSKGFLLVNRDVSSTAQTPEQSLRDPIISH